MSDLAPQKTGLVPGMTRLAVDLLRFGSFNRSMKKAEGLEGILWI
jgi:hypothetical protein